jgi:hypothetical protein
MTPMETMQKKRTTGKQLFRAGMITAGIVTLAASPFIACRLAYKWAPKAEDIQVDPRTKEYVNHLPKVGQDGRLTIIGKCLVSTENLQNNMGAKRGRTFVFTEMGLLLLGCTLLGIGAAKQEKKEE